MKRRIAALLMVVGLMLATAAPAIAVIRPIAPPPYPKGIDRRAAEGDEHAQNTDVRTGPTCRSPQHGCSTL